MKLLAAALLMFFALVVRADDVDVLLDRAMGLETESASLLFDHYRFEEDLAAPESDRMVVFFNMPHGARVILSELTLYLDGKPVFTHPYSTDELMLLQGRNSQLLFLTRVPQGPHSLKAEAKVMQGQVRPMQQAYKFSKGKKAKFLELQFAGYPIREFEVGEW